MKLTKHIRYTVRVREYEVVQVEVGAEADHHDLGYTDADWAGLLDTQRNNAILTLEILLIDEVEKQARLELTQISQWTEISPNLAEDFLSSAPIVESRPTNAQTGTNSTSSRRGLRRTPAS